MPSVAALAVSFRPHAVARIPSPFHSCFRRTMPPADTAPVSFLRCLCGCSYLGLLHSSFLRNIPPADTAPVSFLRCLHGCSYLGLLHSSFLRTIPPAHTAPVSFPRCAAARIVARSTTASFARRRLSQTCPFRFVRALFVASQARSIHISFAPWLLPKPRLFHFLLRAPTCRPAHSTTASFARLRPSQLCPFSSFFAPCLALLAHPSRDVFVRCFQRCRYGSSAFARAPAKIHQPAPASTANASNICSPHRTVPIPGREGAQLRCAALASQDQWRGDVFLLGIFFVGTNLDIVGGRRGVVVVGRE